MNRNEIFFPLDATEKMIFPIEDDLDDIDYCYEVSILLDMQQRQLTLANVFVYDAMQKLSNCLQFALKNELLLHESIKQDIGYVYNEYSCNELLQDRSPFVEIYSSGRSFWAGYKYYLWSSCLRDSSCVTWIYNDVNGGIVFEVTPLYVACDSEEPNCVPYDEWLKSYKPYLLRKLSNKMAQQWLDQAQRVIEQIDNNITRWKQEDFKNN